MTEMLRTVGVVGRFVEFCGAGLSNLSLPDRATIANMAPGVRRHRRDSFRSTRRRWSTCA